MYWIYIPPIILVIALAGLAIMLGRKSTELKKIKAPEASRPTGYDTAGMKERMNTIGKKSLHILEIVLNSTKNMFRRIEQISSGWAAKLKARRSGKKIDELYANEKMPDSNEDSIIEEIEKTEEISAELGNPNEGVTYVGSDVIVRKKMPDQPLPPVKKEPLPEDKVREAALIYRIAENPRDIEAYREIGDYYLAVGNIKDAKESFKMVLKLRPRDLKAKSSLREIEMKMRLGN
jgi:hypothetical protein